MKTPRIRFLMKTPQALAAPWRAMTALLMLLALLGAPQAARAQTAAQSPPEKMSYQGFLVDQNGTPLGNLNPVNYVVVFRIYTTATAGTSLWSEQQTVTVDKGNFSVVLGDGNPVSGEPRPVLSTVFTGANVPLNNAADRYISVTPTISGVTAEILPRLRLMPSPYSFLATRANAITKPDGTSVLNYDAANSRVLVNTPVAATSFVGAGNLLTGFTASQIPSLDGSKITSGVLASAQIPATLTGTRAFTGGKLGVGIASPGFDFHVVSPNWPSAVVESSSTIGTWMSLRNTTSGGRNWNVISTGSGNGEGAGKLLFNDQTSFANRLVLDQQGFVGINNAFPTGTLEVNALAGTAGTAIFHANPSQGIHTSHIHYGTFGDWYIRSANSSGVVNIQDTGGSINLGGTTTIGSFSQISGNNAVLHMTGNNSRMAFNAPEYCDVALSINARSGGCGSIAIYSTVGTMYKAGGGTWLASSDIRLKNVLGTYASSLDQIARIEVVRYKYQEGNPLKLDSETEFSGFVAQDLQKVMPDAVSEGKEGFLAVNLDRVYLAGINAIKELDVQMKAKNAKILALENEVEALKAASAKFESRFAALEKLIAPKTPTAQ
ncbi:MAG: tail fiber domain-containing protein [Opitutaceae bacterium]|nr:tail fiber domain-containing protein [Verrucomicrobiales bacterium]